MKTDPSKLILTREVCEEMLVLGLADAPQLLNKVKEERDKEFAKYNYIEYHTFLKIIVETVEQSFNPTDTLNKLFGKDSSDRNQPIDQVVSDFQDSVPRVENPKKELHYQSPVKNSIGGSDDGGSAHKKVKRGNSRERDLHTSRSPMKTQRPLGGVNSGRGGDFYIGLDEVEQSDTQLYIRAQFTSLIGRFIDSILSDQGNCRDQHYTEEEHKAKILSVVNRKCQNLLTAIFAWNKANFLRLLMMRNQTESMAINVDDIFMRYQDLKDQVPSQLDEKIVVDYLKRILRIEQLATSISRLILYSTNNISEFLGTSG